MWKSLIRSIRKWDSYGKPIVFTFQGHDVHKTFWGGWVTMLAIAAIAIYLAFLIIRLVSNKFVTTTVSANYQDLLDQVPLYFKDYNFSIAFGAIGIPYEVLNDPHYFNLNFVKYVYYYDENGLISSIEYTAIDKVRCNESDSNFRLYAQDKVYLEEFFCPKSLNDIVLEGVFDLTDVVTEFGIELSYWHSDDPDYWAPFDEIDQYDGEYFYVDVIDSYFDADDYEHPIKEYINNELYDYFTYGLSKEYDMNLSKNVAITKDSPFIIFGNSQNEDYLSLENINRYFSNYQETMILYWGFYQSNKTTKTSRTTLNIIDILGLSGGFSSMVFLIWGIMVNFIADKLLYYKLSSRLYQVDSLNKDQGKQLLVVHGQIDKEEAKINKYKVETNELNDDPKNGIAKAFSNKKTTAEAQHKRRDIINHTIDSISSRRMYSYSSRDICYHFWCCWKCKNSGQGKRLTMYDRHILYNEGYAKVSSEFDALNYAKSQRKLKILLESLMDKNELYLSEYQHI